MEADSLFTQEIVREFMVSHGGKVSNPDLIAHFKNFLNDPVRKVANRQQFKTYINNLATVKLDESGTKLLVLKKKFRETPAEHATSVDVQQKQQTEQAGSKQADPSGLETQDGEEATERTSSEPAVVEEVATYREQQRGDVEESSSAIGPADDTGLRRRTPPSDAGEKAEEVDKEDDAASKKEVSLIEQGLNLAKIYFMGNDDVERKEDDDEIRFRDDDAGRREQDERDSVDGMPNNKPPEIRAPAEEPSRGSPQHILRVKEAAMNIEKMENDKSSHLKVQQKNKRESRKPLGSDTLGDADSMSDLDREWLLVSCRSDYQVMAKMLQMNPHLAPKRDFITGFSALHWACKNGNCDAVKLLCGKYSVDANARTSGGYTSLHLATMARHEDVTELLVKVYKADPHIRDYSGRMAKSYMAISASNRTQHLIAPWKSGHFTSLPNAFNKSLNHTGMSLHLPARDDKENTSPISSPISTKPFRPQDFSSLMPPPSKLPPVRRRPTSISSKSAHSDSETTEGRPSLDPSSQTSGSTPNIETIV